MGNNDVFAVIADKTRRGILTVLKDGERPVGDLVAELGVSQPTVSKHLRILRDAGMVSMEAQGQRRLYAVRPEPLAEVTEWVRDVVGVTTGPVDTSPAGGQDAQATEPAPAVAEEAPEVPVPSAGGAVAEEAPAVPVSPAGEQDAEPAPAAVPEEVLPVQPGTARPDPELPVEAAPPRTPRAAGARAVDLLSSLPGFRRRPRHRRR